MLVFLGEVERKVIRQRFSRTAVPGQGIIDIRQRLCTLNRQMPDDAGPPVYDLTNTVVAGSWVRSIVSEV